MRTIAIISVLLCLLPAPVSAQEEARAAYQVTRFDLTVNPQLAQRTVDVAAVLSAANVGRGTGSTFTFRINNKATIKSVNVGGASATFRSVSESYGNLQRVTVTLPGSVAPGAPVVLNISYSLPVEANSGLAAISPNGSQVLPASFWYPSPNTMFTLRGADTAPVKLSVTGTGVISAGVDKSSGGVSVFETSLNAQPFFIQGDWEKIDGTGANQGITVLLPRGSSTDDKKNVEAIINFTGSARTFYAGLLGAAPDAPIRLVSARRGSGFSEAGTILLEPAAFRRQKLDATTALLIAESISRLWLGGETAIRGEVNGAMREGLSRFLATLLLEKQFSPDVAFEERLRERLAYSAVAKRDAPLSQTTPLDPTYFNSVPNKGAMVWRLIYQAVGREAFISTLKTQLESAKGSGLTFSALRAALEQRGGEPLKKLMAQQFDQVTDLDLLIGLPQQRGSEWVSALRNTGTTEAVTTARATTATGEQLSVAVTIPAQNFSEAVFKTASRIVRVEVDPDKLYPQLDYSNDIVPKLRDAQEGLGEASRHFGAQDFVKAESIARELLIGAPHLQEAQIILGRALLGQNKNDEAERVFRAVLEETLPTPSSLAWAAIGLGEIALKKGQAAEAAKRFNDAVRAESDYAASLAARAGRIRAETAVNTLNVDGAIKTFVSQLDQAILSGKKIELDQRIVSGELVRFISGIVGTQPELWQTRVLRTEQLDPNTATADVTINAKELGREQSGTALLILWRVDGGWKLAGIDLFEVR